MSTSVLKQSMRNIYIHIYIKRNRIWKLEYSFSSSVSARRFRHGQSVQSYSCTQQNIWIFGKSIFFFLMFLRNQKNIVFYVSEIYSHTYLCLWEIYLWPRIWQKRQWTLCSWKLKFCSATQWAMLRENCEWEEGQEHISHHSSSNLINQCPKVSAQKLFKKSW